MDIRIHGASDDLIEVNGDIRDEYAPNGSDKWSALLSNAGAGEQLVVAATYVGDTWLVGVTQADEDTPIPPWPIRIEAGTPAECSYSPTLVVEAPAGTVLVPGWPLAW